MSAVTPCFAATSIISCVSLMPPMQLPAQGLVLFFFLHAQD
jgi:hypothetical protein